MSGKEVIGCPQKLPLIFKQLPVKALHQHLCLVGDRRRFHGFIHRQVEFYLIFFWYCSTIHLAEDSRIIICSQENIRKAALINVSIFHVVQIKQLPAFILGEKAKVPSIDCLCFVKFLVFRYNIIIPPNQVFSEHRKELGVDCLLPHPQFWHQHVLRINVLCCLRGCPVAAFGDSHDFPGHAKMFQDGIADKDSALDHVHVLHVLGQFLDGNIRF